MNSTNITFIYGLADPLTQEIRYIGKSNDPEKRFRDHLAEAKLRKIRTYKSNWIYSLQQCNLFPKLIILEEVNDSNWQVKEKFYISIHKAINAKLTNLTDGGEGVIASGKLNGFYGLKHSDEAKQKMSLSKIGKKQSPEHIEKVRQSNIGTKHPERSVEWKAKQRNSHLGRKDSAIAYQNKSNAQTGEKNGNAKLWSLKSPDGQVIQIKSLKTWCCENGITLAKIHYNTKKNKSNEWIILNH